MQRSKQRTAHKSGATTPSSAGPKTHYVPARSDKRLKLGQDFAKPELEGLEFVLSFVQSRVRLEGWPLLDVHVSEQQDPEAEGWKYLVVTLVFEASFEQAEKYLRDFYQSLERPIQEMKKTNKGLYKTLTEKIFFDTLAYP